MSEQKADVRGAGRRLLRRGAQGVSRVRRSVARRPRLLFYLAILGPGVIAASAGNDAGGIATFASVGADHGYKLLWILIPLTFSLGIVQEMCARMGAVTGKGLSDLIRERFGVRWTAFVMIALLIANGGVTVSEFVGIAAATELLGVARYISVPIAAVAIWWLVVKGSYKRVERVFLVMSLVFLAYVVSAFLAHPPWAKVGRELIHPSFQLTPAYLFTFVAVIGANRSKCGNAAGVISGAGSNNSRTQNGEREKQTRTPRHRASHSRHSLRAAPQEPASRAPHVCFLL